LRTASPEPADTLAIRIGTAGWSIPKETAGAFPADGTHLERYARVFDAAEINSSFHRPHRTSTYQRWAAAVPENFRFAVKVPKTITHVNKLSEVEPLLDHFLAEVAGLGNKLGPILVQLPPSLAFASETSERFLRNLRGRVGGSIACEPRHASWFVPEVDALLSELRIGRVAADPAPVPEAGRPGGWAGLTYCRLHGSPRIYYSAYSDETVQAVVAQLAINAAEGSECWCIFDNTAAGAATANALTARETVASGAVRS
jgi:uncharacterized protein YecE (DUF72 family)